MILQPTPDALPHMFLRGFRAPPGGTGDIPDPVAEEVGVFIARQVIGTDGLPRDPGEVLSEDQAFAPPPPNAPVPPPRVEAELATMKPEIDVVIVDDLANFMLQPDIDDPDVAELIVAQPFGQVRINTGAGFGPAIPRHFGWWPRAITPRKELAGRDGPASDLSALAAFDASLFKLPRNYRNRFNNGNPVAGVTSLAAGNAVRFEPGGPGQFTATIPPGPVLKVSEKAAPLNPPLNLVPRVDTVVFDRAAATITFVWRAVFPWEARYETATLEIA